MPTVKIDTPGVTIELDASEVSVGELGKQAMELFKEATEINNRVRPGPASGFSMEREWPMIQPPDEKRVITASESEAQLGLPASSVRAWASQGRIYAVGQDLDGQRLYRLEAVLEIREQTQRRTTHVRPTRGRANDEGEAPE